MIIDAFKTGAFEYISLVNSILGEEARRVYSITFGCQQNEADTEKLIGMAMAMGYEKTALLCTEGGFCYF